MKTQGGFTLIELMIVIAIIGLLLAIAIPTYADFSVRARTTECMNNLAPFKTEVSEFVLAKRSYPSSISSIGTAAVTKMCSAPSLGGAPGSLTISNLASTGVATGSTVITMTPTTSSNGVQWKCTATGSGSKFAPFSCR